MPNDKMESAAKIQPRRLHLLGLFALEPSLEDCAKANVWDPKYRRPVCFGLGIIALKEWTTFEVEMALLFGSLLHANR